jgi:hypothetical protein
MPKVLIANDSGHDFSGARSFGEFVILTKGTINRFRLTSMFRTMRNAIMASEPDDLILLSGPTILNVIACSFFTFRHGRLNLLIFRAERDGSDHYVVRRLVFSNGEPNDQDDSNGSDTGRLP